MKVISNLLRRPTGVTLESEQLLSGWGRTSPTRATVIRPATFDQLAEVLGQNHRRGIIARGLGRSYGDPAQNAGGAVVDMTGIDAIRDVDLKSATVTVDAGISLHRMMQLLVPLGLFVPVTPGTRYVTVGGAIASDIHGKNHHVDGTFADHLLSFDLLTSGGDTVDVRPETEPDLFNATRGGMGLTGFILSATIKMIPIETSTILVDTERLGNIDDLLARMFDDDDRYRYSVAWVDTLARGKELGRGVLYRGNHARSSDDPEFRAPDRLDGPTRSRVSIPDIVPTGLIDVTTARIFNEIWYRKHPELERERPQELSAYFHQLDMVENTNRIYGSLGFVQHQCVLPDGQEGPLRQILEQLSRRQVPTYLVVLKRMGPGNGLLSFPIEGWTLAVDIPAGWMGLAELLDQIDRLVADAGGRLYFAKDSRMNPDLVPEMYPDLEAWREIVDRHDPDRKLVSDLSRRLGLRNQKGAR